MQVGLTLGVSGEAIMPHSFIWQYSWTAMIHTRATTNHMNVVTRNSAQRTGYYLHCDVIWCPGRHSTLLSEDKPAKTTSVRSIAWCLLSRTDMKPAGSSLYEGEVGPMRWLLRCDGAQNNPRYRCRKPQTILQQIASETCNHDVP
jgi:hypothetical protein